jgi:hypothetical protein
MRALVLATAGLQRLPQHVAYMTLHAACCMQRHMYVFYMCS